MLRRDLEFYKPLYNNIVFYIHVHIHVSIYLYIQIYIYIKVYIHIYIYFYRHVYTDHIYNKIIYFRDYVGIYIKRRP